MHTCSVCRADSYGIHVSRLTFVKLLTSLQSEYGIPVLPFVEEERPNPISD